jgi:hypothetical protein
MNRSAYRLVQSPRSVAARSSGSGFLQQYLQVHLWAAVVPQTACSAPSSGRSPGDDRPVPLNGSRR